MAEKYLGEDIKKLGFGLMRLPKIGSDEDIEQVKKMADTFMAKGFTYFDTAYVYDGGKSEDALRQCVVERFPRDSFVCASKLPLWNAEKYEDLAGLAQESLDRAGLEYFDFYLLHALNAESAKKAEDIDAWKFMQEWKAAGKAKHIGFSFHDSAEALEDILKKHPEAEFVQLQINYKDWDDEGVQSRKCYETARKYNKPIVVMEPVKGGSLTTMTKEVQDLFKSVQPEKSIASWAIRFVASLPGIITVLSGMSNEDQMNDNTGYMENFEPLSDLEQETIKKAVEIINAVPTIPCTACKYCVDGCPMSINIPGIFAAMNFLKVYGNQDGAKERYERATRDGGKASDCLQCGQCEEHCPQHISIIETLQEAAELFD
ncbi:MAG: aldo/keto reductase [Lachnospiraceae bacterium]|nr:aldo/keto reductase [Lachnospiraceae bacterium]